MDLSAKTHFSSRSSIVILFLTIFAQKVESESMLVSVTQPAPADPNVNGSEENHISKLENKIENLSFNLRYMQEVVEKWQKNFKLINERFIKLETQVKELSPVENSTPFPTTPTTPRTTTTTTNIPRQIQEP